MTGSREVLVGWATTPRGVVELGKLSFLLDLADILEATPEEGRLPRIRARLRSLRATAVRDKEMDRLDEPAYVRSFRVTAAWRVFEEGGRRLAEQLGAVGWPTKTAELRALIDAGAPLIDWRQVGGVASLAEAERGRQRPDEVRPEHRIWWQRQDADQGVDQARYELWRGYREMTAGETYPHWATEVLDG